MDSTWTARGQHVDSKKNIGAHIAQCGIGPPDMSPPESIPSESDWLLPCCTRAQGGKLGGLGTGGSESNTGAAPHIPHTTSHHITSQHITAQHSTAHHSTAYHITSHHITSQHITSHHFTSHHITSHQDYRCSTGPVCLLS